MSRCLVMTRHWFTVWGQRGLRSPVCMNCGTLNPRSLTDQEWAELIRVRDRRGHPWPNQDLEQAIQDRLAAQRVLAQETADILQEIDDLEAR
jgi:hypothetical protein